MNIQDAFEQIFDDLINEDLSEAETDYVVHEILMPELVILFAEKYDALDSAYDYDPSEDNLNAIFETFCAAKHLSGDLANLLAATINKHAAAEDDEEEDDNNNNVVFKPNYWDELSDDERQAKVKAFLKKIANAQASWLGGQPHRLFSVIDWSYSDVVVAFVDVCFWG